MPKPPRRLFFDASVLFAGCHASHGGSGLLIEASLAGALQPVVSRLVIEEARRALEDKSKPAALLRLGELLAYPSLEIAPVPTPEELRPFTRLVPSKDCHVLASAVQSRSEFLVTLDRRHLLAPAVLNARLPLTLRTPAQLLKAWREGTE